MRLLTYLFLFFSPALWAVCPPDSTAPKKAEEPVIFIIPETMPYIKTAECEARPELQRRKCADSTFMNFIQRHIRYPKGHRDLCIEGTCIVRFVVTKEGKIDDIEVLRDLGSGTKAESMRVIKEAAATYEWIPATQSGKPVNCRYNIPIRFRMQ